MHAAGVHVRGGLRRAVRTALAAGEQQHRVAMLKPEAAQQLVGGLRQWHQAIPIALGVADVHPRTNTIDVANLQAQPFTEPQARSCRG